MARWLLLVPFVAAQLLMAAQAMPSSCLDVPSVAKDASTSKISFVKSNMPVDSLCPGMTYGVTVTFPEARSYRLVSTRGAFKDSEATCVNHVLRSAASTASSEKLYLGCAATGEVKLHVLSMPAGGSQVAKTVTWPITALSACPASPCHDRTASPSTPASSRPTVTSTDDGNTVIVLTGNLLTDLHMLYEMFISSISPFSFPTSLDAGTAFQLVDIARSMQDAAVTPATMLTTVQRLLDLVAAKSDFLGMVSGLKTFLSVMAPYLGAITTTGVNGAAPGAASTTSFSTPGGALDMLSSLASLAGGTAGGSTAASSASLTSLLSSVLGPLMSAGTSGTSVTGSTVTASATSAAGLTSMLNTLLAAATPQSSASDSSAAPNPASMLSTLNFLGTLMGAGGYGGTAAPASGATASATATALDPASLLAMMNSLVRAAAPTAAAGSTATGAS